MTKIKTIMLVDDSEDDNFFHSRVIKKTLDDVNIIIKNDGSEAITYLKERNQVTEELPDLVLLDINMPVMNGWEFLTEYEKLEDHLKAQAVVMMLTTSENPEDLKKAKKSGVVAGFNSKPLTPEMLKDILKKHFLF